MQLGSAVIVRIGAQAALDILSPVDSRRVGSNIYIKYTTRLPPCGTVDRNIFVIGAVAAAVVQNLIYISALLKCLNLCIV